MYLFLAGAMVELIIYPVDKSNQCAIELGVVAIHLL